MGVTDRREKRRNEGKMGMGVVLERANGSDEV
jgi:hypothetical protein